MAKKAAKRPASVRADETTLEEKLAWARVNSPSSVRDIQRQIDLEQTRREHREEVGRLVVRGGSS